MRTMLQPGTAADRAEETKVLLGCMQTGVVGVSPERTAPKGRIPFCVRILRYAVFKVRCVAATLLLTLVRCLCPKPEADSP